MRTYNVYIAQATQGTIIAVFGSKEAAEKALGADFTITKHEIRREAEPARINTKVEE